MAIEFTKDIEELIQFVAYYSMRENMDECADCCVDCTWEEKLCHNDETINELISEYYKRKK